MNSVKLLRPVVLIGMMGSGKSAVGKSLAGRLKLQFFDSDTEIERDALLTVSVIFERYGEPFFRQRERWVIERLMSHKAVIAAGGGAFGEQATRSVIRTRATSVWIDADEQLLWERVCHKQNRPLLRDPDPKAVLRGLMRKRRPFYELADIRVESHRHASIPEMAARIESALSDAGVLQYADN